MMITMTATTTADTISVPATSQRATGHSRSIAMIGGSIVSVQTGAALATTIFNRVGASGVVLMRQGFAAALLLAIARPRVRGRSRADWAGVAMFGVVLALMNISFYESVARLPLGMAVTIELLGPLGLAAAMSRTAREYGFVALAVAGVVLLGGGDHELDLVGVAFALTAAVGWASYILLSRRTGRHFAKVDGLAFAMAIATVTASPFGVVTGGTALLRPSTLLIGACVAMLSAAIPFTLEITALGDLPARTFGIVMSLSPAVAAIVGFVLLGQGIDGIDLIAIACVVVASAGTVISSSGTPRSARR